MSKKKITKQFVDSITAEEGGDRWFWDTELSGFGVRIQDGGRKTYVVRYRTKGTPDNPPKQRKMVVCRCSDAPPDKARKMARDIFSEVAGGGDPAGARSSKRIGSKRTLEEMFKARVAHMKTKERAMWPEVERMLLTAKKNAADFLGRDTPPAAVTPGDIVDFVSTFYNAGYRGAADKARCYLHATFAWAIKAAHDYTVAERNDWGLTMNPVASVAKDEGAIGVRDRNLSAAELRAFWTACSDGNAGFTEGTEICLKLIMACGQRVMETLRAEGKDIDLDEKIWTMPAKKTKGRAREHKVPLPDIIIPELRKLKDKYGDGPLFPPMHTQSSGEYLTPLAIAHAVRRYVTEKDCPVAPFQPRDLRRTWKSRAGDGAGVTKFTRDLIQQHAKIGTGSIVYDWADYLPKMREAMDKWDKWLSAVVSGETPDPAKPEKDDMLMAA